uniref:Cytochrome b n=1 Tax=Ricinus sp. ADS-2020 TaxID=2794903 RepID=A0A7T1HF03_9NEOP|nr:cytochrome b [Ricinus sp. ADS-2020]
MNMNIMKKEILFLPSPLSLSYIWNFGSLLGLSLIIQIITGLFLSFHYNSSINLAFLSIIHIMNDVNYGWVIRLLHVNGATFFFLCMYMHIGRGIYYKSFNLIHTWMLGVSIFFVSMATAFLGYVLPWGQMSYWGATVITNLISAIPYLGTGIVQWVWGGFSVNQPTLTRFFSLHFIIPFFISLMVIIHLLFLHETGSNNPLGLMMNSDKICFHPFFSIKDLMGFFFFLLLLFFFTFKFSFLFMDPDNFIQANPMITPTHIKPEWYFLFAYAILRSVPSKLGGVIALIFSIGFLYFFPLSKSNYSSLFYRIMCIVQFNLFFILTWIGGLPVESPFSQLGMFFSFLYFMNLFMMMMV